MWEPRIISNISPVSTSPSKDNKIELSVATCAAVVAARLQHKGTRLEVGWLSVLVFGLTSCNKQEKPAEAPAQVVQKTFASPDDAAKALVEAAKADNRGAMLAIFGPQSKEIIYSQDAARDKNEFAAFASDYDVMHRWPKLDNESYVLITGADNKVFPIPLKKNNAGHWAYRHSGRQTGDSFPQNWPQRNGSD